MKNNPPSITKRIITYTLLLLLFFFAILGSLWTYGNIIKPSVFSAKHSCQIISDSELNDAGYGLVGTLNITSGEIRIGYNETEYSEEYYRVLRHERVHLQQLESGRLSKCSLVLGSPLALIIDEIEAKTMERFSEKTLNFIYRTEDFSV